MNRIHYYDLVNTSKKSRPPELDIEPAKVECVTPSPSQQRSTTRPSRMWHSYKETEKRSEAISLNVFSSILTRQAKKKGGHFYMRCRGLCGSARSFYPTRRTSQGRWRVLICTQRVYSGIWDNRLEVLSREPRWNERNNSMHAMQKRTRYDPKFSAATRYVWRWWGSLGSAGCVVQMAGLGESETSR